VKVSPTAIADVLIIEPVVHRDQRGFFLESWHEEKFRRAGLDLRFVQDNHSGSVANTLRGLHYQIERPQGKLVWAVAGEIFDVAVDLRRSSPSFGRWVGVTLSPENRRQLWIPPGFAHGYYVTGAGAEVVYKCTDLHFPQHERTLRWNDPAIGIEWPVLAGPPLTSAKDAAGLPFESAPTFA
jgi:dTDP-4-dehydrorhamnose 3,5-epimerase